MFAAIPNAFTFFVTLLLLVSSLPLMAVTLPQPVTQEDYQLIILPSDQKVELGKVLFWDKILSGNKNISCATCHHPFTGTGDGLSLSVGEGGVGLGVIRNVGEGFKKIHERVPRNAPPLFNLGAKNMTVLFHDGRVEIDPKQRSNFRSPIGDKLPDGLEGVLAVQAMFPVTSSTEMAGQLGENTIADAAANRNFADQGGVWEQLSKRLQSNPEYVELFENSFEDISKPSDITFQHAANAIAAYESVAFRANNSSFDAYLRGDESALSNNEIQGMQLFYGKANCMSCHSGKFQTDMKFHAIAMPQIGPGKGVGFSEQEDFGRFLVTKIKSDKYRFRTPPLRNVAQTGPWGHDGAYSNLRDVITHHLDPLAALENYDSSQAILSHNPDLDTPDFKVHEELICRQELKAKSEIVPVALEEGEIDKLISFLHALTDRETLDLKAIIPTRVPSGLTLVD